MDPITTLSETITPKPALVVEPELQIAFVDALVGEGKKYSDTDELAKGYINADKHIHELREKLDEQAEHKAMMEEVLTELRSKTDVAQEEEPATVVTPSEPVSAESIESLVDKRFSLREQERSEQNLQNLSIRLLGEVYGSPNAGLMTLAKIVESYPHLKPTFDRLAITDADAFIRMVTSYVSPSSTSDANTPGVSDPSASADSVTGGLKGMFTWTYCQKVRKEDSMLYKSTEFRMKIEAAVAEYISRGKDFFET